MMAPSPSSTTIDWSVSWSARDHRGGFGEPSGDLVHIVVEPRVRVEQVESPSHTYGPPT